MDPLYDGLIVESKVCTRVDLVDEHALAHFEHERVLERLVIAFRDREDLDVDSGAHILFCRADKIADVLKENDVEVIRTELVEGFLCHVRIHRTFAACVDLDGADTGRAHFFGVDGGIDVGFHDAYGVVVPECFDSAEKDGGLACARGSHDVGEECPVHLIAYADLLSNCIVLIIYADVDIDYFQVCHGISLLIYVEPQAAATVCTSWKLYEHLNPFRTDFAGACDDGYGNLKSLPAFMRQFLHAQI